MISRYFLFSLFLLVLIFLYLAWAEDPAWAIYMVPPAVLFAIVYVLSPQIDWWAYRRRPPAVPPFFLRLLQRPDTFYQRLGPEGKRRFRDRLMLYVKAHDFKGQAMPSVPEDAKMVAGYYAAMVTLSREDFLLKPFERIVFYPHPFPSPVIEQLHTSEMHVSDGVLIFSLPHVMKAFGEPRRYFQPVLYELGRVCRHLWPDRPWPLATEWSGAQLEAISGFPDSEVERVIGTPEVDRVAVMIHHFFQFPDRFLQQQPGVYRVLCQCFDLDPLQPGFNSRPERPA